MKLKIILTSCCFLVLVLFGLTACKELETKQYPSPHSTKTDTPSNENNDSQDGDITITDDGVIIFPILP